jgi:hypothetical protein
MLRLAVDDEKRKLSCRQPGTDEQKGSLLR